VSAGELGAIIALPNDTPFLVLKGISALAAIPLAVGLAIGGQVNLLYYYQSTCFPSTKVHILTPETLRA